MRLIKYSCAAYALSRAKQCNREYADNANGFSRISFKYHRNFTVPRNLRHEEIKSGRILNSGRIMVINSILAPTSIAPIFLRRFECYPDVLPFEHVGNRNVSKVISSETDFHVRTQVHTGLFIRKCKHLNAHTTRYVHKFCVSTCAVLYTCQCKSGRV